MRIKVGALLVLISLTGCQHEYTPEERAAYAQASAAFIRAGQARNTIAYPTDATVPRTCAVTSFQNANPC
jgi:hypothetical protein